MLTMHGAGKNVRHPTTIDMLPDNVLLETFDFCKEHHDHRMLVWEEWQILAHVCQRWRRIIFASPNRLGLQILCTDRTPVSKNLYIWPAFPIVIDYRGDDHSSKGQDIVTTARWDPDRVIDIRLDVMGSQLRKIFPMLREQFPVLSNLKIISKDTNAPALPAEFLGRSAPRLQSLYLRRISFPTLPTLLLSTNDLSRLHLHKIPTTSYISPEAMVTCLVALPRLHQLTIGFQSWFIFFPDRIGPPPVTRTVLPALTWFEFQGASEYLEDLAARIDCPQLDQINIEYMNQAGDFQVAELSTFIGRSSVGPKLTLCKHAQVTFSRNEVSFTMFPFRESGPAIITINCAGIDWQVSHLSQVLSHFSALSNVVHLKLYTWPDDSRFENTWETPWLHLLRLFSAAQTLYVSSKLAGRVALALEDIAPEMVAEVLPSLGFIYLVRKPAFHIEKFAAARRLSGHPVTVVTNETEYYRRFKSFVSK